MPAPMIGFSARHAEVQTKVRWQTERFVTLHHATAARSWSFLVDSPSPGARTRSASPPSMPAVDACLMRQARGPSTRLASVPRNVEGIPGSHSHRPVQRRPVRLRAPRPPARLHQGPGLRRGLRVQGRAGQGLVRAQRRRRRPPLLDVARGLRQAQARAADRRDAGRRRGRVRLLPRLADRLAELLASASTRLRVAGEGDLLAQLEQLRRKLDARRACSRRRRRSRGRSCRNASAWSPAQSGKARDDVLAGLQRRGWAGTLVWAFAPVQDRHAAPAIRRALTDLAACDEVEVIIVARGGGSLADLFAFCDETLCRTVALLRVPVISSVGHHTDRTLLDDVAAVACSTPTHAAETAVPVDCAAARRALAGAGRPARAPGPPRRARPRPHARPPQPRARPPRRPPPHPPAPAAARAARRHPPRDRRRRTRHPHPRHATSRASPPPRPPPPTAPPCAPAPPRPRWTAPPPPPSNAAAATSSASAPPSPPTTPSAPSNAATR